MWIVLSLIAAVLLWLGIDALSLARRASPPNQIEKDEMMFGKAHKPVSEWSRSFAERRYPIATSASMRFYGALFIVLGVFVALAALGALRDALGRSAMAGPGSQALIAGGTLTAVAAVAHLACIFMGPPAYRFMGAGERMARAAEAGKLRPTLVTLAIAAVLLAWALYAFSGAGVIGRLPLTGLVLPAVAAIYIARAVAFPLLKPRFPENSTTFWLWSSGICLVLGLLYAFGSVSVWAAG